MAGREMGIIVPLKFQTFCPIISHLIVTAIRPAGQAPPSLSLPLFPPQIDLAIGRLAFPQWRWRRERGREEERNWMDGWKGRRERKLRRHQKRHHNRAAGSFGDECVVGTRKYSRPQTQSSMQ